MALTVTAVGDSLTLGTGDATTEANGGWRQQVFAVDRPDLITIGGLSDPIGISPHNLHEGHLGYPSASFKASEPGWYIANPADISMIMFGTNDANNGTPTAAVCIQNIVDGVGLILGQNPSAICIVADPPNFRSDKTAQNAVIADIVAGLASALAAAYPGNANIRSRATPSHPDGDFGSDGIHFNTTGYAREAVAWTAALASLRRRPSTAEVASWKAIVGA